MKEKKKFDFILNKRPPVLRVVLIFSCESNKNIKLLKLNAIILILIDLLFERYKSLIFGAQ
jgi:hypothetical protein